MNGRELLIQELLENVDNMLGVIEKQEIVEPDFVLVHEAAEQLREEIVVLQD